MILVDTSVWFEFFRSQSPYEEELSGILQARNVITIEPVFAELLFGTRNTKEKKIILSFWQILPKINFGPNYWIKASEFASSRNYFSKGMGLIDAVLIKSASDGGHLLWTLDNKINRDLDTNHKYTGSS